MASDQELMNLYLKAAEQRMRFGKNTFFTYDKENKMKLKVKRLTRTAKLPTKATFGDMGLDLYADDSYTLGARGDVVVSTGVAIELPEGYGAIIKDRSSLALYGAHTSGGVIDNGYRGEIKVILSNLSMGTIYIGKGQRVAQLLLIEIPSVTVEEVQDLSATDRGEKGFGSTGA